jgi:hypothetical protein
MRIMTAPTIITAITTVAGAEIAADIIIGEADTGTIITQGMDAGDIIRPVDITGMNIIVKDIIAMMNPTGMRTIDIELNAVARRYELGRAYLEALPPRASSAAEHEPRYRLGQTPDQRMNARLKLLGSLYPREAPTLAMPRSVLARSVRAIS